VACDRSAELATKPGAKDRNVLENLVLPQIPIHMILIMC
jgi:hypothetical protein